MVEEKKQEYTPQWSWLSFEFQLCEETVIYIQIAHPEADQVRCPQKLVPQWLVCWAASRVILLFLWSRHDQFVEMKFGENISRGSWTYSKKVDKAMPGWCVGLLSWFKMADGVQTSSAISTSFSGTIVANLAMISQEVADIQADNLLSKI